MKVGFWATGKKSGLTFKNFLSPQQDRVCWQPNVKPGKTLLKNGFSVAGFEFLQCFRTFDLAPEFERK
jgi:hypothetical protein